MITNSALETEKLGEKLAKDIKQGRVIALYGELGAGKTTFVKGLARGLKIKKRIISPTFIFIREYKLLGSEKARAKEKSLVLKEKELSFKELASARFLFHIDLYRIDKLEDTYSLGLEEILSDSKNIIVIEWPEKIKKLLPRKRIEAYFKYLDKDQRRINIKTLK